MKKILLAVLLSATALSAAQAAGTQTTTTTHYHSETYYNWNPFADNVTGLYVAGQAGGTFPDDKYDDSGVYNLSVGWQFHPLIRAEIEGGYRNVDLDSVNGGQSNIYTVMLNGYWDIKNDTRFTPYLGAGAGWAYENSNSAIGDSNSDAFAYQGIAGVSYAIDNNWALTAQYNYIDTTNFDYSAHEVKGGLRYTF